MMRLLQYFQYISEEQTPPGDTEVVKDPSKKQELPWTAEVKNELWMAKVDPALAWLETRVWVPWATKNILNPSIDKPPLSSELFMGSNFLKALDWSGLDVNWNINRLWDVFVNVAKSYIGLSETESQNFANGVIASLADSLTHEINKDDATKWDEKLENDKPKKVKETKKWENKVWLDSWFSFAWEFGGIMWWKDGWLLWGQLSSAFKPLMDVFAWLGAADVLYERLKSIWLLIELTRKIKQKTVREWESIATAQYFTRDQSIINNPNHFTGSVHFLEKAMKANKDIIRPEMMTTEDFNKVITIEEDGKQPESHSIVELLWLKYNQNSQLILPHAFEDLKDANVSLQSDPFLHSTLMKKIVVWIWAVADLGKTQVDNWWANGEKDRELKQQFLGDETKVNQVMDLFAKVSDPNDPTSLYSNIKKWLNLFWWILTGKAFFNDEYDENAASIFGWDDSENWEENKEETKKTTAEDKSTEYVWNDDFIIWSWLTEVHVWKWKEATFGNESSEEEKPYRALNRAWSAAVGKYQFMMNTKNPWFSKISQLIGDWDGKYPLIDEKDDDYIFLKKILDNSSAFWDRSDNDKKIIMTFMDTPALQETLMNDVLKNDYLPTIEGYYEKYWKEIERLWLTTPELMMWLHYIWPSSDTGMPKLFNDKDYKVPGEWELNIPFNDYLKKFRKRYNN